MNKKKSLTGLEKLQYKKLFNAIPKMNELIKNNPIRVIKNTSGFYNYSKYLNACIQIDSLFYAINSLYFPYNYGFNEANHFILPWSMDILETYFENEASPLLVFYNDYFKNIKNKKILTIGISISFVSQIPEGFFLCKFLKKLFPSSFIILGGTCISQVIFNSDEKTKKRILNFADTICYAEGEETLLSIIKKIKKNKEKKSLKLKKIPNLIFLDNKKIFDTGLELFDINKSAPPDYSDLDLEKYLSPSRIILYTPARGCYWNKCSFCTYGFNKNSLHKYREINVEKAIRDIKKLNKKYRTDHFYISCDVMSPGFIKKFSETIINENLKIKWSCDLRIENHYTLSLCKTLKESGLVSSAFGIESGSDKMLMIINKGSDVKTITEVNKNFHDALIATQWMTFVNHPYEKFIDADKTLDLIFEQSDYIDLFIVGDFGLTNGSIIFQKPEQFGIKQIFFTSGDDFKLYPLYIPALKNDSIRQKDKIDFKINDIASNYALNHYPWAGAISTHHSFLYFLKFGQDIFINLSEEKIKLIKKRSQVKNKIKTNHSLKNINEFEKKIMNKYITNALKPIKYKNGKIYAPMNIQHFNDFFKQDLH